MYDPFLQEKVWTTVLFLLKTHRRTGKKIDPEIVRQFWGKSGWDLNPLTENTVNFIMAHLPKHYSENKVKQILHFRERDSVYIPSSEGEERSNWLSDELIDMAKSKGFSILKGRTRRSRQSYNLSGYRIEYRNSDGTFHLSERPGDVAAGYGFDMTIEEVEDFIRRAKPRFQRNGGAA